MLKVNGPITVADLKWWLKQMPDDALVLIEQEAGNSVAVQSSSVTPHWMADRIKNPTTEVYFTLSSKPPIRGSL